MRFSKLVCLALVCIMIASLSFSSLNVAYASEGEIYFVQNADGSYSELSHARVLQRSEIISVRNLEDESIYKSTNSEKFFVKVSNGQIFDAQKVVINSEDASVLAQYDITPKTQELIEVAFASGVEEAVVYSPRSSTVDRRTYTGFNGFQYFEEVVTYTNISIQEIKIIQNFNFVGSWETPALIVGEFIIGGFIDSVTYGAYSVVSLFLNNSTYPNIGDSWSARLKTRYRINKVTHIIEDGSYRFGYGVEKADTYFYCDYIPVQGNRIYKDIDVLRMTPNFSSLQDRLAYFNYVNGGVNERLGSIKFGGQTFAQG